MDLSVSNPVLSVQQLNCPALKELPLSGNLRLLRDERLPIFLERLPCVRGRLRLRHLGFRGRVGRELLRCLELLSRSCQSSRDGVLHPRGVVGQGRESGFLTVEFFLTTREISCLPLQAHFQLREILFLRREAGVALGETFLRVRLGSGSPGRCWASRPSSERRLRGGQEQRRPVHILGPELSSG